MFRLFPAHALETKRKGGVLDGAQSRQKIEGLKDHSDFLAAQAGTLIVVKVRKFYARDADRAARRIIQTADQVEQRGFARAGGTHDGHSFALRDADIDIAEGMYDSAFAVVLADLL
jgi:hypothetical protein